MGSGAKFKFVLKAWPGVFVLAVALAFLTGLVGEFFGFDLQQQVSLDVVLHARGWNLAFLMMQVVLLAPILEELLFRGALCKLPVKGLGLLTKGPNRGVWNAAAVLSSALFSFTHYALNFSTNPHGQLVYMGLKSLDNAFLALFFFGLAQCWIYRRTGSLWCAMLNHALFNLTNLVLLFVSDHFGISLP